MEYIVPRNYMTDEGIEGSPISPKWYNFYDFMTPDGKSFFSVNADSVSFPFEKDFAAIEIGAGGTYVYPASCRDYKYFRNVCCASDFVDLSDLLSQISLSGDETEALRKSYAAREVFSKARKARVKINVLSDFIEGNRNDMDAYIVSIPGNDECKISVPRCELTMKRNMVSISLPKGAEMCVDGLWIDKDKMKVSEIVRGVKEWNEINLGPQR